MVEVGALGKGLSDFFPNPRLHDEQKAIKGNAGM